MDNLQTNSAGVPQVIEVRPLGKRDAVLTKAMVELFRQGQAPHHRSFPDHFGPAENEAAVARYLQGFLKPRNPFRTQTGFAKGLFVNEKVSGYLLYRLSIRNDVFYGQPRWNCHIEDIVVDRAARGNGGASAMMSEVLAELSRKGECSVSGTVWKGNEASIALFQNHGFEPLSQSFHKLIS